MIENVVYFVKMLENKEVLRLKLRGLCPYALAVDAIKMGNNKSSCVVASLAVCSGYLAYFYIYRSHKLLKTNVLSSNKLPSLVYLHVKYLHRVMTRRSGCLHAQPAAGKPVYTLLNCRLQSSLLRTFCRAAGYGWDYPDSEFRDLPLCFPEFLCCRLLLLLLTDENFMVSPSGLVRVRQTLKTLEPIDELKKGPFVLQAGVQGYHQTDAGVEVDICLSAASRSGCLVWESILTLLSKNKLHKPSRCFHSSSGQSDEPVPESMKQVELRVPRTTGLQRVWSHQLLSLPTSFFRSQTAPGLWMLSVCLAEIEKHKGVGVITAPVQVTAQFKEPLLTPGNVVIRFWESTKTAGHGQPDAEHVSFHMQQPGLTVSHIEGLISRS